MVGCFPMEKRPFNGQEHVYLFTAAQSGLEHKQRLDKPWEKETL